MTLKIILLSKKADERGYIPQCHIFINYKNTDSSVIVSSELSGITKNHQNTFQ